MITARAASRIALFALLLAACGSAPKHGDAGYDNDLSSDAHIPLSDAGPVSCHSSTDCVFSGYVCAYEISQGCAATTGICMPLSSDCGELRVLCGCNGKQVDGNGDCKYPKGYASGPTMSLDSSCGASDDGGDTDAGSDGF